MLSICPMRQKPEESSEMISQIVFGEQVNVISESDTWLLVKSRLDGYKGWIDKKLVVKTKRPYDEEIKLHYCLETSYPVMAGDETRLITFGAILPNYDGISFKINGQKFSFSGSAAGAGDLHLIESMIEKLCCKYLYSPYLWGGKTPFGVDCSGFVQTIYRVLGVDLPRDARNQAKKGITLDFTSESMTGDLAYFTTTTNRISHVGVILDNNRIIHASGRVRIDTLDHNGIYNAEIKEYSHRLKVIKRVL